VSTKGWVVLADELREAGSLADPAETARVLRDAGVRVTRDSRARWVADPRDPRVRKWMQNLAEATDDG
jgi:hypothetical protein